MYINISYDEEFTELMVHLKAKYGYKMFEIDGIDGQLDINKYSREFFSSTVTTDVSVDGNSNVSTKDTIVYNAELPKPYFRLNAYYLIWRKLKQLYGHAEANRIIEMQLCGDIYINDFHGVGQPYSYHPDTYISIEMSKDISMITMEKLFRKLEKYVEINEYSEYIDLVDFDIKIFDKGKWVKLLRLLRHKSHCNLLRMTTSNDSSCTVTEDHPVILRNGIIKEASGVILGNELLCYPEASDEDSSVISICELEWKNKWVYDVTTETGTFYSTGLIVHNCFNFSTYDIALEGLTMVNKIKSIAPKYLYSFKSQLEQFVTIASNSILGASGIADLVFVLSYYVDKILETHSDAGFKFASEEDCWRYVKENIVSFIYTINQPMRVSQSLVYDEYITVINDVPSSDLITFNDNCKIGTFVENFLNNGEYSKDISSENMYTYSMNRNTGMLEPKKITGVIKHENKNKIVKYVLANGQTVTATDNHSFFTRNGLDIEEVSCDNKPTNLLVPFNFLKQSTDDEDCYIKFDKEIAYNIGYTLNTNSDIKNSDVHDVVVNEFNYYSDITVPRDLYRFDNVLYLIGGFIDADSYNIDGWLCIKGKTLNILSDIQFILMSRGILSTIKRKQLLSYISYELVIDKNYIGTFNEYTKIKKFNITATDDLSVFDNMIDFDNLIDTLITKYDIHDFNYCFGFSVNYNKKLAYWQFEQKIIKALTTHIDILESGNYNSNDLPLLLFDVDVAGNTRNKYTDNIDGRIKQLKRLKLMVSRFMYALPIRVIDIIETDDTEYVYDISVEGNENFLTTSNVYAHNSPFTNISVFDDNFLKSMIDQYSFPDGRTPSINTVKKVQALFIDVMNEEQRRTPVTFPVNNCRTI